MSETFDFSFEYLGYSLCISNLKVVRFLRSSTEPSIIVQFPSAWVFTNDIWSPVATVSGYLDSGSNPGILTDTQTHHYLFSPHRVAQTQQRLFVGTFAVPSMFTVTKRQRIENAQDSRFIVFFHRALHRIHNEKAWISSFPCCGGLTFAIKLPNWEALDIWHCIIFQHWKALTASISSTDILIYSDLSSLLNPACFF